MASPSTKTGWWMGRIMGDLFHLCNTICVGESSARRGVLREQSCCPTCVRFSTFETTGGRRLGGKLQGQLSLLLVFEGCQLIPVFFVLGL